MFLEFLDHQDDLNNYPLDQIAEILCDAAMFSPEGCEFSIREGSEPDTLLFDYGLGNACGRVLSRGHAPADSSLSVCESIVLRAIAAARV
jgi:hypothetical protein